MKRRRSRYRTNFSARLSCELAEATASYGEEMIIDRFKPMSTVAQRRWIQAQHKPGRPRRGKGVKVIAVSVERGLLQRSDKLAKELHISRARLIERGLKIVLAANSR